MISPFDLNNNADYLHWREQKQRYRKPVMDDLLVQIENPYQLPDDEKKAIVKNCANYNMAIYQLSNINYQDKSLVHVLGEQLEMINLDSNLRADNDSVSSLEVREQSGNQYIPYTNKALSWHTDGYYNCLDKQVFGIIMHCVRPADTGGVNQLVNPEQIYIRLRDEKTAYIEALTHPQAMTIPANIEAGRVIREAQTGPVFMVKSDDNLHMRFSARKRNIIWRDTDETRKAVEIINKLLLDEENILEVRLQAGQGIVCNNVLHNRSAFTETERNKRLMYRARYYDAVG